MAAEPTSTGTSARRRGGLARIQRLDSLTARTTEAVTTSARWAESTWPATLAFGHASSAFLLPPGSKKSNQRSSSGSAMIANIERTTEVERGREPSVRKREEKQNEEDDPRVADPHPGREQRRQMRLDQDLSDQIDAPDQGHERTEPVLRPPPPRVEAAPGESPTNEHAQNPRRVDSIDATVGDGHRHGSGARGKGEQPERTPKPFHSLQAVIRLRFRGESVLATRASDVATPPPL